MDRTEDPVLGTRQSYDDLAEKYAAKYLGGEMRQLTDTFVTLLPPGASVLDLGCGPARDVASMQARGLKVVGLDLSFGLLCQASSSVRRRLVQGDMRNLPFPSKLFDGVWLCASLLHIPKEQARGVLAGVRRVMGLGSVLYLGVKQGQGEEWTVDFAPRFFTYYQPDEIKRLLMDLGFDVESLWIYPSKEHDWINLFARKAIQ
jgi:ubiquinone/menaquinone biosynthesis C-methylase UbiE